MTDVSTRVHRSEVNRKLESGEKPKKWLNGRMVKQEPYRPTCAYCSMPAEFTCDVPDCLVPMCAKDVNHMAVDGRQRCRVHRIA